MRRDSPELWEDEVSHDALCQYCGGLITEMSTREDVYITSRGWLCERCYVEGGKPHCLPRPYKVKR